MTASKTSLLTILILKGLLCALLIAFLGIDLAPDEAQYWTWSQDLALGYYSKPPAIAWQIALSTALFGNTVFGVRAGALLLSFLLPLVVYNIAKKEAAWAFWGALLVALSPFGIFFSFPATTDLGMILFFTLAIGTVYEKKQFKMAGVWILLGALYKWSAFSFWLFPMAMALFDKTYRKKSLFVGIGISLLALIPSLLWNLSHDFATFRHVGATLFQTGVSGKKGGNFFDFLGAQIGLLSPIFFGFIAIALCRKKTYSQPNTRFLALFPLALTLFLLGATFKKMQPNWALFLFPPSLLLGALVALRHRFWRHLGVWVSVVFSLGALSIPFVQTHALLPLPYKVNPFRQTLGWSRLPSALKEGGYNSETDFLFGDKYQTASLLSFYNPTKKRAYFFNLNHQRKNQFSYWPSMSEKEIGKTGYFLVAENTDNFKNALPWYEKHLKEQLSPYFDTVEVASVTPLFKAHGEVVKFALLFKCKNYNGLAPQEGSSY